MRLTWTLLIATACCPTSALASRPEQLEQLEPDSRPWQFEYNGLVGSSDGVSRQHSLELSRSVARHLSLGVELEFERERGELDLDEVSATALWRLSDPEDDLAGTGLMLTVGLSPEGQLTELEARLIAEKITSRWWGQGNIVLRRSADDGRSAALVAYGWSLSRAANDGVWLGVEGSGQAAQLWGGADGSQRRHFAGLSLTAELDTATEREIEIGLAYLKRVSGEGPAHNLRLFVQYSF